MANTKRTENAKIKIVKIEGARRKWQIDRSSFWTYEIGPRREHAQYWKAATWADSRLKGNFEAEQ